MGAPAAVVKKVFRKEPPKPPQVQSPTVAEVSQATATKEVWMVMIQERQKLKVDHLQLLQVPQV